MIVLRWALIVAIAACVIAACVMGIANGVLLLAGIFCLALAWTLREPDDCDCPVDHSEALLDDEQTPA